MRRAGRTSRRTVEEYTTRVLSQIKVGHGTTRYQAGDIREARMTVGETWYLALIIGGFSVFMLALAWVERNWKPKTTEAPSEQMARADRQAA
jgi:hypothetical protein